MRKFFKEISELFVGIMFGTSPRCALIRGAAAFILAFWVVFNPFSASRCFRIYLYIFCSGIFLLSLCRFKFERKMSILLFAVFAVGVLLLYCGRGDSVSGIGIALFSVSTAFSLFSSINRRLDRTGKLIRTACGICAMTVSIVIVARCGQLGVRYLDQLHSYALVLAGCGFSNFMLIKRGDI